MTEIINPVFVALQAPNLLLSTQATLLDTLAVDICNAIGIDGPHDAEIIADLDDKFHCKFGRWSVSYDRACVFLENLGMHCRHTLEILSFELLHKVLQSVAKLAISIVEGIVDIQAERDATNSAANELPSILPHQLVKISTADYGHSVVDKHLQQLRHSWTNEAISQIEIQHRQLCNAYRNEIALKAALDSYAKTYIQSFEKAWDMLQGRYDFLRDFCGGIATVFPNTASVESDFSILGYEKDAHRLSITDLSLEGVMQCKQYEFLKSLEV